MEITNTYSGDSVYCVDCTGDCVVGDDVRFTRAIFTGSYKKPKFQGYEIVTGTIIAESYGADRQQHTFTILLPDGRKTFIKGRNLYRHGTWRKRWENEAAWAAVLEEKHQRGKEARRRKTIIDALRNGTYVLPYD